MTAVTTAGLLAGLFGSAFVPVANGAGRTAPATDTPPKASLTVITLESKVDDNADQTHFGFLSADSDIAAADDAVAMKFALNTAGNVDMEEADLKAVSSNDDIQLAWLYDHSGAAPAGGCSDQDSATDDNFSDEDIVEDVDDVASGIYWLCLAAAEDDTAATSTVTIYAQEKAKSDDNGWVLIDSFSVTAIGPTDEIALSITDAYRYVAEENVKLEEWLTVKCYDANGTLINDSTASISSANTCGTVTEDSLNGKNNNDTAINFIAAADETATSSGAKQLYDLLAETCNEETDTDLDDAGTSYSLKVAVGTVKSNAITITCTENGAGAVVTGVTASDTTGPQSYDDGTGDDGDLNFVATVVDEDGRPLGDGAGALDFGAFTFDAAAAVVTELEANDPGTEGEVTVLGGEAEISDIDDGFDFGRRGKFTIEITVSDSDLGAATDVAETFTLTYTVVASEDVTISYTRNAAKTRATVTVEFGEDEAYERVVFYVENAAGVVKEYVRRANAEGVATFKFVRRNATFFVYADLDAGGAPTDIVSIRFR